uniref:Uncharacterized protein n=1 Tax=Trichogramma kaykai TaxID=54128 RepID=A0ABD2WRD4_9HYME
MGVRAQAPDYYLEVQAVSIISRVAAHPTHVELYGTRKKLAAQTSRNAKHGFSKCILCLILALDDMK